MAELLIQVGRAEHRAQVLPGIVTSIGRTPENSIVLDHESVSSRHAEIISNSGTLILRDLQSANGTRINGEPVHERILTEGDRIAFAQIECVFRATDGNNGGNNTTGFQAKSEPPPVPPKPTGMGQQNPQDQQTKAFEYFQRMLENEKFRAAFSDLRSMDFKSEVLPLNSNTFVLLKGDFVFWVVTLLAVVPLFLVTLKDTQTQLVGFCLFFAAIWGLVFKKFVIEETGGWRLPIFSLFFTGVIGMNILSFLYGIFPQFYMGLTDMDASLWQLVGYIFQTGICEELCKIIPVVAYLIWKRRDAQPLTMVLIGVFSGLGFAAFENLGYAQMQVLRSVQLTSDAGAQGLSEGVKGAMVNVMLRSMSSVFGHAVYSGIFASFLALAEATRKRYLALALVGLLVSATVHGLYDWFWTIQNTLPALLTAFGFILFYAYLTKLRLVLASVETAKLS